MMLNTEVRSGSPTTSELFGDDADTISVREKALVKRSVSKHHNNNLKAGYVPVNSQFLDKTGLTGRKTFAFWTLVVLLFLLAVGNLAITVAVMSVLRLGKGMATVEILPEELAVKFFGETDLGYVYKRDGLLESFEDEPMEVSAENGEIILNLTGGNGRPLTRLAMRKTGTLLNRFGRFLVKNNAGEEVVNFSHNITEFEELKNVKSFESPEIEANRISSPVNGKLRIEAIRNATLKGSEGLEMDAREIYLKSNQDLQMNGSLVFEDAKGIFIDFTRIPIAFQRHGGLSSSRYKVCVCMPKGKLFVIPVGANGQNQNCHHVNLEEQPNLCA